MRRIERNSFAEIYFAERLTGLIAHTLRRRILKGRPVAPATSA